MIHIKYIVSLLLFSSVCFYFGMNAGADKMGMHRIAGDSMYKPENRYAGLDPDVFYRLKLDEALRTYGRYLDSYSYYAPDLNSLDRRTNDAMIEIKNRMLELDPDYFSESYSHYDKFSNEFEGSDKDEWFLLKRQLKLVEGKLNK